MSPFPPPLLHRKSRSNAELCRLGSRTRYILRYVAPRNVPSPPYLLRRRQGTFLQRRGGSNELRGLASVALHDSGMTESSLGFPKPLWISPKPGLPIERHFARRMPAGSFSMNRYTRARKWLPKFNNWPLPVAQCSDLRLLR